MRMREGATAPRAGRLGLKLPAVIARQRVHEARFHGREIGRYCKAHQRRAGAWEGITLRSCPRHLQTLLQTGECQGRTNHGEMQRAEEREPGQDNKHGGVPRPLCTS